MPVFTDSVVEGSCLKGFSMRPGICKKFASDLGCILQQWSIEEHAMFANMICRVGKDFAALARLLKGRTIRDMVAYYYTMRLYRPWVPLQNNVATFCLACNRQSKELEFFKCASRGAPCSCARGAYLGRVAPSDRCMIRGSEEKRARNGFGVARRAVSFRRGS